MSEPLREGINKLVLGYLQKKLETGEAIDVVEMTHEMAQSLIDMIMEQEELHQAPLLASVIASLGDFSAVIYWNYPTRWLINSARSTSSPVERLSGD